MNEDYLASLEPIVVRHHFLRDTLLHLQRHGPIVAREVDVPHRSLVRIHLETFPTEEKLLPKLESEIMEGFRCGLLLFEPTASRLRVSEAATVCLERLEIVVSPCGALMARRRGDDAPRRLV